MKICSKCNIGKPIGEYYKNSGNTLGLDPLCKECKKEYRKSKGFNKWNSKYNLNVNKEYKKEYFLKNKEHIYARIKKWRNIPKNKISCILRVQINNYIRKGKGKKHTSVINLIGCDIHSLKQYLEQQFKPEMTWENHGIIWEIDHIKACANFDLTKLEEQKQCFHYTNLQPLFKTTEIAESFGYINQIGNRNKNKY